MMFSISTVDCPGYPVSSITVVTREHDRTKMDGEVSHAVCSKTEHPDYNKLMKNDQDIAILRVCQLLMFSEGKFLKVYLFFDNQIQSSQMSSPSVCPAQPRTTTTCLPW